MPSCACAAVAPPLPLSAGMHASTRVCACVRGKQAVHGQKHACKHPGEHLEKEVVGSRAPLGRCGRRHLAAVLRLHPHAGACCCRGPVRTHQVGAHVQGQAQELLPLLFLPLPKGWRAQAFCPPWR